MSQPQMVLDYMNENGSITSMEAFDKLGVTRLSQQILILRRRGFDIASIWETGQNRYGVTTRYVRYKKV